MRTLTLKRQLLTELLTDELRGVGGAQPTLPPVTSPEPPSLPLGVRGCVSWVMEDSLCVCVSTGGTTR